MTYHHGNYWAEILPVRSQNDGVTLYWEYRIYASLTNEFVFNGHDSDLSTARKTAEAHIDRLLQRSGELAA